MTEERKRIEIRLHDLGRMILRRIPAIICWSVFLFMLLFTYKTVRSKPVYKAEASIYVLSRTPDSDYGRLDVSDLDVSRQMIVDSMNILNSEQMAEKVLINLSGDAEPLRTMRASDLLSMTNIQKQDDSLVITIEISGPDPYIVCDLANAYKDAAITELSERIMARGIQSLKDAIIPQYPSGRSPTFYGAVGFLLGLISSIGVIILVYVLKYAERKEENVGEI